MELQNRIWEFAVQVPRILEAEIDNQPILAGYPPSRYRMKPRSRLPLSILTVSRDARSEGLRYYELRSMKTWHGPRSYYYSPTVDIVYVARSYHSVRSEKLQELIGSFGADKPIARLALELDHVRTYHVLLGHFEPSIVLSLHGAPHLSM